MYSRAKAYNGTGNADDLHNKCVTIVSVFPAITDCLEYDEVKLLCTLCSSAGSTNRYWNGTTCATIPLANCVSYDATSNICITCDANTYLTNQHCCAENKFYSLTGNACLANVPTLCARVNSAGTCTKCITSTTHYLNVNNVCCPEGKMGDTCVTGTVTNCLEYSATNICSKCSSTYTPIIKSGGVSICYTIG